MRSRAYDHLVKTIIVGDSGVGKTCLLRRFSDEPFVDFHMATIGVDFAVKNVTIDGKKTKLQIWDTAGQEKIHTITTPYYPGADAILLVFDVTNPESFEHCERWLNEIRDNQYGGESANVLLVANKIDVKQEEQLVTRTLRRNLQTFAVSRMLRPALWKAWVCTRRSCALPPTA